MFRVRGSTFLFLLFIWFNFFRFLFYNFFLSILLIVGATWHSYTRGTKRLKKGKLVFNKPTFVPLVNIILPT
ncbi:hypothetical protein Hanom_Chr02g00170321 [Helianthus anomalus]